jgi:hypothetical protein
MRDQFIDCGVSGLGVGFAAGWTWRHYPALSPTGGPLLLSLWIAFALTCFALTWRGSR